MKISRPTTIGGIAVALLAPAAQSAFAAIIRIHAQKGNEEMKSRGRMYAIIAAAVLAATLGASGLASQASATTAHRLGGGSSSTQSSGYHKARAATGTPACTAGDLGVWVAADHVQGVAGTLYMPLEFTNRSQQTCTLFGFPGVSALSSAFRQLGSPAAWAGGQPGTVTLAPGRTAHAILQYSNAITGNCPATSKRTAFELRVYPPGQTQADHALWAYATCTAPGSSVFMTVQFIAPGFGF
jgi:hypothetical protein